MALFVEPTSSMTTRCKCPSPSQPVYVSGFGVVIAEMKEWPGACYSQNASPDEWSTAGRSRPLCARQPHPDFYRCDEFEAEVNEWMNELALETASSDDSVPFMETPAIQKAKLSSIFGSALQPLSNEDLLAYY